MEPIRIDEGPEATLVSFTRAEKRNALDMATSRALSATMEGLRDVARPVVLRSATPGMFVAGADLSELHQRTTQDSLSRLNQRLFQQVHDHPWPTIAAVDGWALGGGCELALSCDLRVSTARALSGLPEVRLGIIPSGGALHRLERLIGGSRATELILTGGRIDGARACEIGLVHRIADVDALEHAVERLVAELAATSAHATRLAKEAMRVGGDRNRLVDAAAQALCIGSEDAQRRIGALLDGEQR